MATRVQIAFDQSATAPVNFFTLDDAVRGVLDNTAYVLGGDILVDVTSDVRSFQIRRGRSRQLERFTAGNANVALNNFGASARKYDPLYGPTFATRTNLVTNPSFEVNTTGWSTSFSSISRSTTQSRFGTASGQVVSSTLGGGVATRVSVSAGVTYYVTGYVYLETATATTFDIWGVWRDSGGSIIAYEEGSGPGAQMSISSGSWVRFYTPITAPVGAVNFDLYFRQIVAASRTWYLDGVLCEQSSTQNPYFDGTAYDPSIDYYSSAWTGTANASTSTITYYTDRGSPYYGSLVPRKQIVIDVGGTAIYTGQIADWNYSYSLSGESIAEPSAVDALGYVAQQNLTGGTATSQKSGARVGAILDEIGWPSATRNIATGDATLDANYVQPGSNALQILSQVGDVSEPGAVFVGAAGDFIFKSRSQLQSYTSNVVFGGTAVSAIPFVQIQPIYGSEELFNEIAVTYTAGTVVGGTVVASDATSQTAYGVINKNYDTFLASAVDAADYASYQVGQRAQPVYRVNALSVFLESLTNAQQAQVLGLDLGSVVLVNYTPNDVGSAISQYSTIEQIEHQATPKEHRITFTLSKTTASFILDDAVFGTLDNNSLGF